MKLTTIIILCLFLVGCATKSTDKEFTNQVNMALTQPVRETSDDQDLGVAKNVKNAFSKNNSDYTPIVLKSDDKLDPPKLKRMDPAIKPYPMEKHTEVILSCAIGIDGKVKEVVIVESSGDFKIDKAAIVSAATAEFTPAKLNGKPTIFFVNIPYKF